MPIPEIFSIYTRVSWNVLLVYLVIYINGRLAPLSEVAKTLIAVAAILLLAVPPLLIERRRAGLGTTAPAPRIDRADPVPDGAIEERISVR